MITSVRARPVAFALAYGLAIGGPAIAQRPPAAAPVAPAAPAAPITPDSAVSSAQRARMDSIAAGQRQRLDSLRAAAERAAAGQPASRSPFDGDPPFYGYTLAFYANIIGGAVIGLIAFLLRQREALPNVRRWWGVAGVVTGAIIGAVAFLPIFMVFSIMSIGVNPPSPGMMFGLALLATAFIIAFLTTFRIRRRRR